MAVFCSASVLNGGEGMKSERGLNGREKDNKRSGVLVWYLNFLKVRADLTRYGSMVPVAGACPSEGVNCPIDDNRKRREKKKEMLILILTLAAGTRRVFV